MLDSMRGALIGSGVGIPLAFAGDLAAGTLGSALEQYISTGSLDVRESVTRGLNNAISNAFYGTAPLGSIGEAFGRGFGAGMANGGEDPFAPVLGYGASRGYRYEEPGAGRDGDRKRQ